MSDLVENKPISNKELRKITLTLAMPVIAEMLLQTLMSIADTAMVGRLGAYAITSVGLTDTPMMIFMAFFSAIGAGGTALVARYVGAKNYKDGQRTAHQAMFLSIIFSIVFTTVGLLLVDKILIWMGAEKDVLPYAAKYFKIVILGIPFMAITMIMSGVLRGIGDTKTPMFVNGLSNILNIVGNFFMIFESRNIVFNIPIINNTVDIFIPGAGMGVAGAAIATTFGRFVAAMLIIYVLYSKKRNYRLSFKKSIKCDAEIIKKVLKIGMPAAAEQLTMRFAQLFFTRMVAKLGTVVFAAHKVAITAESISFMPGWGFSLAATTLVGQYLGADRPDISKRAGNISCIMACIIMSAFAVSFFIFPQYFIRIFTNDLEIISNGMVCLKLIAIAQPLLAMTMVYAGALRGAGDTKTVLGITTVGMWTIRVGLAYYMINVLGLGLSGAWTCMVIDFGIRGILLLITFNKGKWKEIKI